MNQKSFQISRQAAPIRTQTLRKLRKAILDSYFKPGDRLYEKELCEQFGVSRTSIREALRQLEAEALVTIVPNQGPIVTRVSQRDAEDIYQVRELLECLASRLFAERATDKQVRDLAGAVDSLERAYLADDIRAFLKVKTTVYEILFSGCGNNVAHSIFKTLIARVNVLRKTSLSQPGRTPPVSSKSRRFSRLSRSEIRRRLTRNVWSTSAERRLSSWGCSVLSPPLGKLFNVRKNDMETNCL